MRFFLSCTLPARFGRPGEGHPGTDRGGGRNGFDREGGWFQSASCPSLLRERHHLSFWTGNPERERRQRHHVYRADHHFGAAGPAYLVASTVEAVLAQRLVRLLCPQCKRATQPGVEQRPLLGEHAGPVFVATGCDRCRGTGFRGRTGIYELVWMDEEVRALVVAHRPAGELRRAALGKGMISLREDGLRQVRAGTTTLDEVLRVTEAGG